MKFFAILIVLFASAAEAQQPIAGPIRNLFHRWQQRFHPHVSPAPEPEPSPNVYPSPQPSPVPDVAPAPTPVSPPMAGVTFYVVLPSLTAETAEQAAIERSPAVHTAIGNDGFEWLDMSTAPKGILAAANVVGLPAMLAVDFSLPTDKRLAGSAKLVDEKSLISFIECNQKSPAVVPAPPIPEKK